METLLGAFAGPPRFQRPFTQMYTDTKNSSDFVAHFTASADDPDMAALHRKIRVQKDRLLAWGLDWSESAQSEDIDESVLQAGVSDVVSSVMSTIKESMAGIEQLFKASTLRHAGGAEKIGYGVDIKPQHVPWNKVKFDDFYRDLTGSIDILHDLSQSRRHIEQQRRAKKVSPLTSSKHRSSLQTSKLESSRIRTPQLINPASLIDPRDPETAKMFPSLVADFSMGENGMRYIVYLDQRDPSMDPSLSDIVQHLSPLLLEYAPYDPVYASTGINPEMDRFENLFAGLQMRQGLADRPTYGMLNIFGYFEDNDNARFGILYELPVTAGQWDAAGNRVTAPALMSLDMELEAPLSEPPLETKFRLAYRIAGALMDCHAKGISHGAIHNYNIGFVTLQEVVAQYWELSASNIRRPFLLSFDVFPESAHSDMLGQGAKISHSVPHHPLDPRVTNATPLTHASLSLDLFALGLLLLEIGVWSKTILEASMSNDGSIIQRTNWTEEYRMLEVRCGKLYSKAVQSCLEAVDVEIATSGHSEEALQGTWNTVLSSLERLCALDDEDENDEDQPLPEADLVYGIAQYSAPVASANTNLVHAPEANLASTLAGNVQIQEQDSADQSSTVTRSEQIDPSYTLEITDKAEVIYPTMYAGERRPQTELRLFHGVPLAKQHSQYWDEYLGEAVCKLLRGFMRRHLEESMDIGLDMVGISPQTAMPFLTITCTSIARIRHILQKRLKYDSTTYGILVLKGSIVRTRGPLLQRTAGSEDSEHTEEVACNASDIAYQQRLSNGASISATHCGIHYAPVSFGGLIMVDDDPYGLTVHHMLEPDQHEKMTLGFLKALESTAHPEAVRIASNSFSDAGAIGSDSGSSTSDETRSQSSATEGDSDDEEPGDLCGLELGDGNDYFITQPSYDDVVDTASYDDLSSDAASAKHLAAHRIGTIHATSGIRRREEDGKMHEIDWTLFKFDAERMPFSNHIDSSALSTTATEAPAHPIAIVPWRELGGLDVYTRGRTTGLQKGKIGPTMHYMRFSGRVTPSLSYQISGNLGKPGDSGAWVVDSDSGRVCGHVLGRSTGKNVAFFCPMDIMIKDIQETLEVPVGLPGSSLEGL